MGSGGTVRGLGRVSHIFPAVGQFEISSFAPPDEEFLFFFSFFGGAEF